MYIPEEMKLNKFKSFGLPSARDYFKLTGERITDASQYSGDELDGDSLSKVEASEKIREYAEKEIKKIKEKESKKDSE